MEEEEIKMSEKQNLFDVHNEKFYLIFALTALVLFLVTHICRNFGVWSTVFYGIMSIFVFGISLTGAILSFCFTRKLTLEFWFNIGVFALFAIA